MAARKCGSVAEWLKAAVLKTADGKLSVSSNLTASAIFKALIYQGFEYGDGIFQFQRLQESQESQNKMA